MINKIKRFLKFYFFRFRCKTPDVGRFSSFVWGDLVDTVENSIPKIIWIYWEDEIIKSETVNICIETIKNLHTDYEVRFLNKNTIGNYISFDNELFRNLPLANKSDLIRLKLLSQYGGIYLDASVLVLDKLDWVLELNKINRTDTVAYYTEENTMDMNYPVVETWLLASIPNASFINDWLKEYEECLISDNPNEYYKNATLFDYKTIPLDVAYYKCYFSAQTVIRKSQNYRLSLICADTDAFLYSLGISHKWSNIALAEILLLNDVKDKLPRCVKIINGSRITLDHFIDVKNYKRRSIIGRLIDNRY